MACYATFLVIPRYPNSFLVSTKSTEKVLFSKFKDVSSTREAILNRISALSVEADETLSVERTEEV